MRRLLFLWLVALLAPQAESIQQQGIAAAAANAETAGSVASQAQPSAATAAGIKVPSVQEPGPGSEEESEEEEEEENMASTNLVEQSSHGNIVKGDVDWQGKDDNELCRSWALQGECIRNPQFMWSSCMHACSSLTYVDAEADCSGWTAAGECEKNPGFMLEKCNKSCVDAARKGLHARDHTSRPNPHLAESLVRDPEKGSRLSTFLPIFLGIGLLLAGGVAVSVAFAPMLAAKQEAFEDELTRLKVCAGGWRRLRVAGDKWPVACAEWPMADRRWLAADGRWPKSACCADRR